MGIMGMGIRVDRDISDGDEGGKDWGGNREGDGDGDGDGAYNRDRG